jgi:ketosteroid isomerase-like protein
MAFSRFRAPTLAKISERFSRFQDFGLAIDPPYGGQDIPSWPPTQEFTMTLRSLFSGAVALALIASQMIWPARADDAANAAAASDAFYAALPVLDDGTAMEKVFAQTPYVTFVSPMSKDIIVGWPAVKTHFGKANAMFKSRKVQITNRTLRVNGNLAWEVGVETGGSQLKSGPTVAANWVVTNVLEKQPDGKWLMVSHHVQPGAR